VSRFTLTAVSFGLLLLACCRIEPGEKPNYKSLSSEQLINLLASPAPPLYTNRHPFVLDDGEILRQNRLQPHFAPAHAELAKRGRSAWDDLIRHLDDSRYSTSSNDAEWENWTVGDICFQLISDQIETYRKNLDLGKLTPCYLSQAVGRNELRGWVETRRGKSLRDLRLEATDWALGQAKAIIAEHHMRPEALEAISRYRVHLIHEAD
jgi:hypothetical protein